MITLAALWMPIVLSAVIVFVASFLIHMVLGYHKSDYRKLPDENAVSEALRKSDIRPGTYYFPHLNSPGEMKNPEVVERFKKGPVGMITLMPAGPPAMGKNLVQWFLYCVLMGVFVAYLGGHLMPTGQTYPVVFRFTATIAFLGYGVGNITNSIWRGQSWGSTFKHVLDGFIYGLLTGGTFGWLWPR